MNYEQAQAAIDTAFPRVNAGIRRFWVGALVSEHQRHGTTADEFVARLKKSRKESADAERELRAALRKNTVVVGTRSQGGMRCTRTDTTATTRTMAGTVSEQWKVF